MCKNDFKWRALVKPEGIKESWIREGLRQKLMRINGYDSEGSPVVALVSGNWEVGGCGGFVVVGVGMYIRSCLRCRHRFEVHVL